MSFYFPLPEVTRKSKTVFDCDKCGFKKNKIESPEMKAYVGKQYDGLVILGSYPSKEDDESGFPFADKRSKVLRSAAIKSKINLAKHSAMLHAVSCYNPTKKKTSETNYKCCVDKLDAQLKELRPKLIICCGEMAFKYLFGLKNKTAISKLRNRIIPNYTYNCLVFPVYDPYDFKMYNSRKGELDLSYYYGHTYKWDLERVFKLWNKALYKRKEINNVLKERKILENISIREITSFEEAKQLFSMFNKMKEIALDYETTNTFPYDEYFEIVYVAFSNSSTAWVFHEDFWIDNPFLKVWFKKQMVRLLNNPKVCKIIQNEKFEDLCSRYVYGTRKITNSFCTMLAAHTIDEKEGCVSLDFQNLIRFGIPPYNEAIKKYITTDKKAIDIESDDEEESNDYTFQKVNRIREAPKGDMIQYNGLDVITCFNQYLLFQRDLLDLYPKARENYEFLHEGHHLFAQISERGMNIGEKEINEFESLLDKEIKAMEDKIISLPEIQEYNKVLEAKNPKTKKKRNDKQLKDLCFGKPKRIRISRKFTF
jgi:uracil-DNA glycosylase family 4